MTAARMIDLHCHLLPGVDDGASSTEQALCLARAALDDGIGFAMLTPHMHAGRYENTLETLAAAFRKFCRELKAAEIPLRLGLAAELRLSDEIHQQVEQRQLPFLGGWYGDRVLLLELPHSHIPPGTDRVLRWLAARDIRAMIAHPERNRDVLRDYEQLAPLVRAGCLFQVTAGALAGRFGSRAESRARRLVKEGLVTVLATDAHHPVRRPPMMTAARKVAEKLVGESRAWELVYSNPARIVDGGRRLNGLQQPQPAKEYSPRPRKARPIGATGLLAGS